MTLICPLFIIIVYTPFTSLCHLRFENFYMYFTSLEIRDFTSSDRWREHETADLRTLQVLVSFNVSLVSRLQKFCFFLLTIPTLSDQQQYTVPLTMQNDKYGSTNIPEKEKTLNRKRNLDKICTDAPRGSDVLFKEYYAQNTMCNNYFASKVPCVASPSKSDSQPQQEMIPYPSRLEPHFKKPENYQRKHHSKSNGNLQFKRDGSKSRYGHGGNAEYLLVESLYKI